jgi:hypothetical protein
MKTMKDVMPSWDDPKHKPTHLKQLAGYAKMLGFNDKEIQQFGKDDRVLLALTKAMMCDLDLPKKGDK